MKLEKVRIKNFRCFGENEVSISIDDDLTALVGTNGAGKTAFFTCLSRMFGISNAERKIQKKDFYVSNVQDGLKTETELYIDCVFGLESEEPITSILFLRLTINDVGENLKLRCRLKAKWIDDGTVDGNIEEEFKWITSLSDNFDWAKCSKANPNERTYIRFLYIPAQRNANDAINFFLKASVWKTVNWSENIKTRVMEASQTIQTLFENESPLKVFKEKINNEWNELFRADTLRTIKLSLTESKFDKILKSILFLFEKDEQGDVIDSYRLSDGQKSLFQIALINAILEIEKAREENEDILDSFLSRGLTIIGLEEPENNLSPFFISRILGQCKRIANMTSSQTILSTHSPSAMTRIEPESIRYFINKNDQTYVKKIYLPENNDEKLRYVRLAVKSYPELYFSKFVILGEGASEKLILQRLFEANDFSLDSSFVAIVPLGGRFVDEFWKLLDNLEIPYATILDLDLGRKTGGLETIKYIISLKEELTSLEIPKTDEKLFEQLEEENSIFLELEKKGIFFSRPIDIDFSMLSSFFDEYTHLDSGARGPAEDNPSTKKSLVLKTGGSLSLYDASYNKYFNWYPYLFLDRGKPGTHIKALARIDSERLKENAPDSLKRLVQYVEQKMGDLYVAK